MSWIDLAIGSDEATIIDMRISVSSSAQLFLHIIEFMMGIVGHSPICGGGSKYLIAVLIKVPVITCIQSFDDCGFSANSINTL